MSGELSGTSTVVENIGFDGVHRFFNIYDNAITWKEQPAVQVVLEDVTQKVMLDIDDFKSINDTYGHMVGDELKRLARIAYVAMWLRFNSSN